MANRLRMPEAARFMSHVKRLENGCWSWTAFKLPSGYGFFRTPARHELAHRAAHRLFKGDIPAGLEILHSCDFKSCVNPAHLSVGDRKQNMREASERKRFHPKRKLSHAVIAEIRASTVSQHQIAKRFSISQGYVSQIKSLERRTYVGDLQP